MFWLIVSAACRWARRALRAMPSEEKLDMEVTFRGPGQASESKMVGLTEVATLAPVREYPSAGAVVLSDERKAGVERRPRWSSSRFEAAAASTSPMWASSAVWWSR